MVSASNIPKYLSVSFSSSLLIVYWFGSSIPSIIIIIIIVYSLRVFHISIICIIIIYSLEFFTSTLADGLSLEFDWQQVSSSLQDSSRYSGRSQKCCHLDSPTHPPTSKSSRPFNNPLVIVPKVPITIGTIITFMFHSFFNSLARLRYLSFFSHSFSFILWSARTAKSTIWQFLFFFLLIIIRSGLLAEIWWSMFMIKSHRSLWVLFSRAGAGLCIYHLLVWLLLLLLLFYSVFFSLALTDNFHWSMRNSKFPGLFWVT